MRIVIMISALLMALLMFGFFSCSQKNQINYKELFLKEAIKEHISRDIPYVNYVKKKIPRFF